MDSEESSEWEVIAEGDSQDEYSDEISEGEEPSSDEDNISEGEDIIVPKANEQNVKIKSGSKIFSFARRFVNGLAVENFRDFFNPSRPPSRYFLYFLYCVLCFPFVGCIGIHWLFIGIKFSKNVVVHLNVLYRALFQSILSFLFLISRLLSGLIPFKSYKECERFPYHSYCLRGEGNFLLMIFFGASFLGVVTWIIDGASLWYFYSSIISKDVMKGITPKRRVNPQLILFVRITATTICIGTLSLFVSQLVICAFTIIVSVFGITILGYVEAIFSLGVCGIISIVSLGVQIFLEYRKNQTNT